MLRQQVKEELSRYLTCFPDEAAALVAFTEQLDTDAADMMSRANMRGHVTTSAFVLDQRAGKALLIHHRILDRWLQPGGHYEVGARADAQPMELWASALREVVEETGVLHPELHAWTECHGCPFDVDSHPIAANPAKGEAAHFHHDLTYLASADSRLALNAQVEEVHAARWMSLVEVRALGAPRLTRIVEKLFSEGLVSDIG